jgi:hypothetical protein
MIIKITVRPRSFRASSKPESLIVKMDYLKKAPVYSLESAFLQQIWPIANSPECFSSELLLFRHWEIIGRTLNIRTSLSRLVRSTSTIIAPRNFWCKLEDPTRELCSSETDSAPTRALKCHYEYFVKAAPWFLASAFTKIFF